MAEQIGGVNEAELSRLVDERVNKALSRLVDERISKALGLSSKELEELPGEQGLMATPSVLSTVRATATAMC